MGRALGSRTLAKSLGRRTLFVVAGLPRETATFIQECFQREGDWAPARYVSVSFPRGHHERIYYRDTSLEALLLAAGGFALGARRQSLQEGDEPTPTRIYLLYVLAADYERVLNAVDFFAYPVPLPHNSTLSAGFERRTGWRFDPQRAFQVVRAAVKWIQEFQPPERYLKSVIVDHGAECALRLPPRNFLLSGSEQPIADSFREARRPGAQWDRLEKTLEPVVYSRGELPGGPLEHKSGRCFKDARGLLFPPDPTRHGLARQLARGADPVQIRHLLNQMYRFGMPLLDGYHHDAQFTNGRGLEGLTLHCAVKGPVQVRGRHANIYPNDFVRF